MGKAKYHKTERLRPSPPEDDSENDTGGDNDGNLNNEIKKEGSGLTYPSLAKQVGVKPGNAQRWMKEFKVAGEEELSLVKSRGKVSKPKLNDNHKDFLKDYVDENSSSN
ncbi:unnamed protein product [Candida parapsilosis]